MLRKATLDDIPALVAMGAVMHAESPHFSRLRFNPDRLAKTIAHAIGGGFAMVVDNGGEIFGVLLALVVPHWCSDDLVSCDLALFVRPEMRGGLAAKRLLDAYAQWAEDEGAVIRQLGLTTGVHPEMTQALCERLGWRQVGVVMEC